MHNYAQINENNKVVGISQLSMEIDTIDMILISEYDESLLGKIYNGSTFDAAPEPTPVINTKMTTNSFLLRIDPETAAIDLASIDDPTADTATRLQQADLRKFMRYIDNATYIDLARPQLISGLNTLVGAELMLQTRMDEVLNTPVTEDEEYK